VGPPGTIGSVVSTVLVSLGVVAAAICVLLIALSDPDQPATLARPTRPARPRRHPARTPERTAVESEVPAPSPHSGPQPSFGARASARTAPPSLARALWTRARSAMALAILVTFTGVVLAALVGTGLAVAVRAFTRAVQ
jgi:hypothetical protein